MCLMRPAGHSRESSSDVPPSFLSLVPVWRVERLTAMELCCVIPRAMDVCDMASEIPSPCCSVVVSARSAWHFNITVIGCARQSEQSVHWLYSPHDVQTAQNRLDPGSQATRLLLALPVAILA